MLGMLLFLLALVGVPTVIGLGAWAYTRIEREDAEARAAAKMLTVAFTIDTSKFAAALLAASQAFEDFAASLRQAREAFRVPSLADVMANFSRLVDGAIGPGPDGHAVLWDSEAGRQMDEIDRIIEGKSPISRE